MPRKTQDKVTISNKAVTRKVYSNNRLVERIVETPIKVPAGSIKHIKAQTYKMLEEKVKALEISPWFGESVAKAIKNSKRVYVKKRPPNIIEWGLAEQRFKRTWRTDADEIILMHDILREPEKFGLDDECKKKELFEKLTQRIHSYKFEYPHDVLRFKTIRNSICKTESNLRHWYWCYKNIPDWEAKKIPIEELKKFYEDECAKVDKKLASKTSQVNTN